MVVIALWDAHSWDPRVLGQGSTEFFRLGRAIVAADLVVAFGGLALMVQSVHQWVFLVVPLTGLLCLAARFGRSPWLHARRSAEHHVLPELAVGSEKAITDLIRRTRRAPYFYFGWRITASARPPA